MYVTPECAQGNYILQEDFNEQISAFALEALKARDNWKECVQVASYLQPYLACLLPTSAPEFIDSFKIARYADGCVQFIIIKLFH